MSLFRSRRLALGLAGLWLLPSACALLYNETLDAWNINKNKEATQISEYTTVKMTKRDYTASPTNWRELPCYTLLLDKWMDGEPSNDDFFKTMYEYDSREVNLRNGGDAEGLLNARGLDYLQGMGVRSIYIAGTYFLNMPWQADGYSAIDFTLLDPHYGTLAHWADLIDEMHRRDMYIILDFTVGTMGDFIGFKDHLNVSTPFNIDEYEALWKRPTYAPWGFDYYPDFNFTNVYNETCELPTFWLDDGSIIDPGKTGCYASEFDQYGDIEAFGVFPDWQRQLAKFASVQDRLREWTPLAADKLKKFGCLSIEALDIDGIRIDKATQVTVGFMADWSAHTRQCAEQFNKGNFFIPGEITGGDTFGALYIGRGRTPQQRPPSFLDATNMTQDQTQYFLREADNAGLDSSAFHYSVYRSLCRFLGMDGNLNVAYDIDVNFVTAWNQLVVTNDFLNHQTNEFDPRHMFGTTNQDVFRWPSLANGTERGALGIFISTLVLPGMPLLWYGEEQELYLYDNGAANYLYGRQSMISTRAWQRHGCYRMGSSQYYNMPYDKALTGCDDDWNSLDHFDPTVGTRRTIKQQNFLRESFPSLMDGFNLIQWGNWTYRIQLPGSNVTQTEIGMWSTTRAPLQTQQGQGKFVGDAAVPVWLMYTNENKTTEYTHDCKADEFWISTPYAAPVTVRNLLYPYDEFTLEDSLESYNNDSAAPWRGCLPSITLEPFAFKAFVPVANWVQQHPAITSFTPGHDARVLSTGDTIDISMEFDTEMQCASVSQSVSITFRGADGTPTIDANAAVCGRLSDAEIAALPPQAIGAVAPSVWRWSNTIRNAPDGIYEIIVDNPRAETVDISTNSRDHLMIRKGALDNVMVWPEDADYSTTILTKTDGSYSLNHTAYGADKFRYTGTYGQEWSDWADYDGSATPISEDTFKGKWWDGQHIQVQYWSAIAQSATHIVHGDHDFNGQRRWPQLLARGAFNNWGFDLGVDSSFDNDNGDWSIPLMASWPSYVQLNVFGFDDYFYGDSDGDGVLDRLPPNALSPNYLNMSLPPSPFLAWTLHVNDKSGEWTVTPLGHQNVSIILFALLISIPLITAFIAAAIFRYSFYAIKVNKWGIKPTKETNYFQLGADKKDATMASTAPMAAMSEKPGKNAVPAKLIGWPEIPSKRRKVLIATLEYEILDWKLKVKIGGLGVMSTLMGKAMSDVDLIWVIPKVKDLDYPQGEYAEPIEVVIFGEPYLIEVELHVVDNITYVILDSPVFRAQTKSDPYPQRMDDLSSAIFYSTWNQAIAEAIRRNPIIDIYHINDYHGALAPLYLLPKVIPVCLSLHNAEFQGLWPLRTKDEMKEVCAAFNIPKEICSKYVQFGNTFNLLHAAASYISHHQKSIGVAGVSDKYGKRSWARYPALWTLRNIDSLPNPDPTDIAALEAQPIAVDKIVVDEESEAKRPEQKRLAQEWAGIKQDPTADLFVFVGRWSKQKGVDLIADVMPALLDKKPKIQLICVGPVIDLYGRFAAEKLARLMEMYPDRVFSKPEFTSLPPYLFSGADFALIPSRDEPFGLVAVEFGRKGALGVGARLGGLGLMPGWWFPVESSATVHMLSQLTKTIKLALKSTEEERAILRARSAVQRFPVVEWRQRLEDFQRRSIIVSRATAGENAYAYEDAHVPEPGSLYSQQGYSTSTLQRIDWNQRSGAQTPDSMAGSQPGSPGAPGSPGTPGDHDVSTLPTLASNQLSASGALYHRRFEDGRETPDAQKQRQSHRSSAESFYDEDPNNYGGDHGQKQSKFYNPDDRYDDDNGSERYASQASSDMGDTTAVGSSFSASRDPNGSQSYDNFLAAANRQIARQAKGVKDPFLEHRQSMDSLNGGAAPNRPFTAHSRASSFDSISSIMDEKGSSSPLNKAIETFTDSDGEVAQSFVQRLQNLSAKNTQGDLCIEKFLMKSEKAFFTEVKREKMSSMSVKSSRDSFMNSRAPSMIDGYRPEFSNELPTAPYSMGTHESPHDGYGDHSYDDGPADPRMTRLQIFLQRSIGGWPLYTVIISFGQLLSATSFQLTLLTGNNTQTAVDLYIIGAIFFVASIVWYTLFRMRPSVWVLTVPWLIFAVAFFLIGLPSLHGPFIAPQKTITAVATWCYGVASAAGFLFFGLNFGEEAGAATEIWIMRACIVQGLQQIWVSALWYWGASLNGKDPDLYQAPRAVMYIVWPLAVMSLCFAYMMFKGLPDYYRQIPPYVPNFFRTLARRKLVIWFMISEVLRNYWLSAPYGRNWSYLWNNKDVPAWAIVVMIAIFFIGVWGLLMGILIRYAKIHSWLLPVFAVGLGCPRWCQMYWGTSGIAYYIPWGGDAGPYIGTSLWLWLGVLDAIQGVGLGMILLQTLSRLHVCATLAGAQMLGSIVVMIARATSPNKLGPGGVFPDPAKWDVGGTGSNNPLAEWAFWLCLACQIVIPIGYFIFFRKEQLSKP